MKNFEFAADYLRPMLKSNADDELEFEDFEIDQALKNEIIDWNEKYQHIIPLDQAKRAYFLNDIEQLDNTGLQLAKKLEIVLDGKVRYFSEGHLKYAVK